MPEPATSPPEVVAFWQDAGRDKWFAKDPAFDQAFRDRFLHLHMAVAARCHDDWTATPNGTLALLILTDQFPRNAFRGTAHMYTTDALARHYGRHALQVGHWDAVHPDLRQFIALPFAHSEDIADQYRSVALAACLGTQALHAAERHREIIRRFARFPHRNAMFGRDTTEQEAAYLAAGGFAG